MEGINVQIKHLAQCLALGYLVNVSSFLSWWWRPSSPDFLPESIMCFCTSWMPSPLDLGNSFPADILTVGWRGQFFPRQPRLGWEGCSSRPGPPALSAVRYVWQSELSDGIAMLVAGNDRVQAVITQMEEVCQTIEVSLGWEGRKVSGLLEVGHK